MLAAQGLRFMKKDKDAPLKVETSRQRAWWAELAINTRITAMWKTKRKVEPVAVTGSDGQSAPGGGMLLGDAMAGGRMVGKISFELEAEIVSTPCRLPIHSEGRKENINATLAQKAAELQTRQHAYGELPQCATACFRSLTLHDSMARFGKFCLAYSMGIAGALTPSNSIPPSRSPSALFKTNVETLRTDIE